MWSSVPYLVFSRWSAGLSTLFSPTLVVPYSPWTDFTWTVPSGENSATYTGVSTSRDLFSAALSGNGVCSDGSDLSCLFISDGGLMLGSGVLYW